MWCDRRLLDRIALTVVSDRAMDRFSRPAGIHVAHDSDAVLSCFALLIPTVAAGRIRDYAQPRAPVDRESGSGPGEWVAVADPKELGRNPFHHSAGREPKENREE